jgi:hypothetical protein
LTYQERELDATCWYIAIDTLSTLGSLFSSIPPYHVVRDLRREETDRLFVGSRRLLALLNAFLTNELPLNARRLYVANASSTRRGVKKIGSNVVVSR